MKASLDEQQRCCRSPLWRPRTGLKLLWGPHATYVVCVTGLWAPGSSLSDCHLLVGICNGDIQLLVLCALFDYLGQSLGTPIFPLCSITELGSSLITRGTEIAKWAFPSCFPFSPLLWSDSQADLLGFFWLHFPAFIKNQNVGWVKFLVSEDFSLNTCGCDFFLNPKGFAKTQFVLTNAFSNMNLLVHVFISQKWPLQSGTDLWNVFLQNVFLN